MSEHQTFASDGIPLPSASHADTKEAIAAFQARPVTRDFHAIAHMPALVPATVSAPVSSIHAAVVPDLAAGATVPVPVTAGCDGIIQAPLIAGTAPPNSADSDEKSSAPRESRSPRPRNRRSSTSGVGSPSRLNTGILERCAQADVRIIADPQMNQHSDTGVSFDSRWP
jgi:hypothetical protein